MAESEIMILSGKLKYVKKQKLRLIAKTVFIYMNYKNNTSNFPLSICIRKLSSLADM